MNNVSTQQPSVAGSIAIFAWLISGSLATLLSMQVAWALLTEDGLNPQAGLFAGICIGGWVTARVLLLLSGDAEGIGLWPEQTILGAAAFGGLATMSTIFLFS